jgi:hypothetical protein
MNGGNVLQAGATLFSEDLSVGWRRAQGPQRAHAVDLRNPLTASTGGAAG